MSKVPNILFVVIGFITIYTAFLSYRYTESFYTLIFTSGCLIILGAVGLTKKDNG